MENTLYFNNPKLFSPTFGHIDDFLGDTYDLTGVCLYANMIDNPIVFSTSGEYNSFTEIRENFEHDRTVKLAEPKKMVIFKNFDFYSRNIIFEIPKNIKFINCIIRLSNSFIASMPNENCFSNCVIYHQFTKANTIYLSDLPGGVLETTYTVTKNEKLRHFLDNKHNQ